MSNKSGTVFGAIFGSRATQEEQVFPAQVVEELPDAKIAIDRGAHHGLRVGQRFVIYNVSDVPAKHSATGKDIERFEVVKGEGIVSAVQEETSIIELHTVKREQYKSKSAHLDLGVAVGDKAKPI